MGPVGRVVVWIWGAGTPASTRAWRLAAHRSRSQRFGLWHGARVRVASGARPGWRRADESGGGGAEGLGDGLVDVGADLVAGRGDGGADPGDDVGRAGAEGLHGGERRGGHPGHGAAPARVHAGEHGGHRIVQHDRHAVRGQDRKHHPWRRGDQRVGVGDGIVEAERSAPPVGHADHADRGAVHLAGEHEVLRARPETGRQPAPVLEHAPRVVADAQAQVQRRVGPGRHPAGASRDGGVSTRGVQDRPGQQGQPADRAERGGRRRRFLGVGGHRVRA